MNKSWSTNFRFAYTQQKTQVSNWATRQQGNRAKYKKSKTHILSTGHFKFDLHKLIADTAERSVRKKKANLVYAWCYRDLLHEPDPCCSTHQNCEHLSQVGLDSRNLKMRKKPTKQQIVGRKNLSNLTTYAYLRQQQLNAFWTDIVIVVFCKS